MVRCCWCWLVTGGTTPSTCRPVWSIGCPGRPADKPTSAALHPTSPMPSRCRAVVVTVGGSRSSAPAAGRPDATTDLGTQLIASYCASMWQTERWQIRWQWALPPQC